MNGLFLFFSSSSRCCRDRLCAVLKLHLAFFVRCVHKHTHDDDGDDDDCGAYLFRLPHSSTLSFSHPSSVLTQASPGERQSFDMNGIFDKFLRCFFLVCLLLSIKCPQQFRGVLFFAIAVVSF